MKQLTLDDPHGQREAVDRVERHAAKAWKEHAYEQGLRIAQSKQFFTSLDIIDAIPKDVVTHEPRAMGAIMRRLAHEGICIRTNDYVASHLRRNHNRPVRVWHSRLYGMTAEQVKAALTKEK